MRLLPPLPGELHRPEERPRGAGREGFWTRILDRAGAAWAEGVLDRVTFTSRALAGLLALVPEEREGWLHAQDGVAEGLGLAERLIEVASARPLGERLDLARLAARVSSRALRNPADRLFEARLGDVLGRCGLLEVSTLRRLGRLDEACARFAEVEAGFAEDASPLLLWLTLAAERALTAALFARDEGRFPAAVAALSRAGRIFRWAATKEEDHELLLAWGRTDLARGAPHRALGRLAAAAKPEDAARRRELGLLHVETALRAGAPHLARHAVLRLLADEAGSPRESSFAQIVAVAEAAVRLAEGRPTAALEAVAGPAERLRAEGVLLGSLRAALVAARAELARRRQVAARQALASGVLERFSDLPDVPAVRAVLSAVKEGSGTLDSAFLARLELWLILAADSPGIALPESR